jgi:hypothetical protein
MIEFENFVYLDVYRTGSKHIIKLLRESVEEREVRSWRHSSISKGGPFAAPHGKVVFTTVRNPWDWYVSLWSYGANKVEAIRRYLLEILPRTEVKRLYDTSNPESAFREWLTVMHDPALADRFMHENYPQSRLSPFMGLYTYRFLRVTTWYPYYFLRRWRIRDAQAIRPFHARRKAYESALRNERLTDDLVDFVLRNADRCRFRPNAADIIRAGDPERINASARPLTDYRQYYDEHSRLLVEARDSFFIEEFGYRF